MRTKSHIQREIDIENMRYNYHDCRSTSFGWYLLQQASYTHTHCVAQLTLTSVSTFKFKSLSIYAKLYGHTSIEMCCSQRLLMFFLILVISILQCNSSSSMVIIQKIGSFCKLDHLPRYEGCGFTFLLFFKSLIEHHMHKFFADGMSLSLTMTSIPVIH